MANDKDPLKQLKHLTQLRNQLQEIQRQVESEVSVGIPHGSTVLGSPFFKGFLAGYVVAKLRSSAVVGMILGTVTGMYVAQNYQVPNIEKTFKEYMNNVKKAPK
ncbi:SLC35A4 upstream open reading frame protein-like [Thalassophryne amazonica]|uniref:SLC35A4 upstream open reading frame protein-like n=1 Tax=Thalassophryne amazonica TaxID=390379 RepID=UPI001471E056|nr:SLC35A4 upstream open reading frame protein-like [Thalassophryne amazonica]